jgi:hypothetical protein
MPCVGFEPTIPASERAKTVHALDRSATVTGDSRCYSNPKLLNFRAFNSPLIKPFTYTQG